jgi:very-short-patch-repair endonuclease
MKRFRLINEAKHNHGAVVVVKDRARFLRKIMTPEEEILWKRLRKGRILGKYFRRQHPYGIYILDFYCDELKLAIEVDGRIHQYREEYDLQRTNYLKDTGIEVIRFNNNQIKNDIASVIRNIEEYILNVDSSYSYKT